MVFVNSETSDLYDIISGGLTDSNTEPQMFI